MAERVTRPRPPESQIPFGSVRRDLASLHQLQAKLNLPGSRRRRGDDPGGRRRAGSLTLPVDYPFLGKVSSQ
jgi:hypothetical protein